MSTNPKSNNSAPKKVNTNRLLLACTVGVLAVILLALVLFLIVHDPEDFRPTEPTTETTTAPTTTAPTTAAPTETESTGPTEPQMLAHMAELYAENPEIVAWVRIPDTKLDYPVMYAPEEKDKYLFLSFDEKYSKEGTPYLKEACTVEPQSQVHLIYGHNMKNGNAFNTIMSYEDEDFYKEHPIIEYTTLYEERKYEIVAVFRDRVYLKSDTVFKYYQFLDPETEEEFDEGIAQFKKKSLYDTGITPEYGDHLITLVTCAYHTTDGRFVVVARQIVEEPSEGTPETPAE